VAPFVLGFATDAALRNALVNELAIGVVVVILSVLGLVLLHRARREASAEQRVGHTAGG
jgi:hypothetical protein